MMSEFAPAGIGHNKAPPLREILAEKYEATADEISAILGRFDAAPEKVTSDEDDAAIGSVVVDARKLWKVVEAARDTEGRPHLEAKKEIDGFFKAWGDRLNKIVKDLESRGKVYRDAKLAEERRAREAERIRAEREAAEQRAKAEAAAEAGRHISAAKHADKAEEATERAAEVAAAPKAADVTRHRGDGFVATTRTEWTFEVTDWETVTNSLGPLGAYMGMDAVEKAIRAFVKARKNTTPLPGVRIYEDTKASYR